MLFFNKSKAVFSSLGQDSEDDAERDGMLEKNEYAEEKVAPKSQRFWNSKIPWICSTVVLAIYIIATSLYQRRAHELWSPTDIRPARPLFEDKWLTFTAGLDYNNSQHILQHTPKPGPSYVGPPTREIDELWMDLAGIQEIYLTKEEAIAEGVGHTYRDPLTGLYEVEIESLHHLHCLNYIRKSMDIERYPDILKFAETWRMHFDHCIDTIREFLMCKADFTPIVLVPPGLSGVPVPMPEFRTTHVCRNFDKLLNWVKTERSAGSGKQESIRIAKLIRQKTGTKY